MRKLTEIVDDLRALTYQYEDHPSPDLADEILKAAAELYVANKELQL